MYCNVTDIDELIGDQVMGKCMRQRLRRKLLGRNNVSLKRLQEMALTLETSERQATAIGHFENLEIDRVKQRSDCPHKGEDRFRVQHKTRYHNDASNRKCYACGYFGNERWESSSPAERMTENMYSFWNRLEISLIN